MLDLVCNHNREKGEEKRGSSVQQQDYVGRQWTTGLTENYDREQVDGIEKNKGE
jgi:hypothetical protein